jgi:hypothetical protein
MIDETDPRGTYPVETTLSCNTVVETIGTVLDHNVLLCHVLAAPHPLEYKG